MSHPARGVSGVSAAGLLLFSRGLESAIDELVATLVCAALVTGAERCVAGRLDATAGQACRDFGVQVGRREGAELGDGQPLLGGQRWHFLQALADSL